jgi:hypothetical protein
MQAPTTGRRDYDHRDHSGHRQASGWREQPSPRRPLARGHPGDEPALDAGIELGRELSPRLGPLGPEQQGQLGHFRVLRIHRLAGESRIDRREGRCLFRSHCTPS